MESAWEIVANRVVHFLGYEDPWRAGTVNTVWHAAWVRYWDELEAEQAEEPWFYEGPDDTDDWILTEFGWSRAWDP